MGILTAEMKEVFARNKPKTIATASRTGIPQVVPMSTVQVVADDTVWIGVNYTVKTIANVQENSHLALFSGIRKRSFVSRSKVQ